MVVVVALVVWRDIALTPQGPGLDGPHIALELLVLALLAVDGELGFGHGQAVALEFFPIECDGREHKVRLGCLEVLAQGLDEVHQVLLVAARVGCVLVLVPLPEDEPGHLVTLALVIRIVLREVRQDLFGVSSIRVVLLAGVPVDGFWFCALVPGEGCLLVAGVDLSIEFVLLAARGQQIPAEAAVAGAGLEDEDGLLMDVSHDVTKLQFDADEAALDGQRVLSVIHSCLHIMHVLTRGPVPFLVEKMRVLALRLGQVLQGALCFQRLHLAKPEHVGLAQEDVHLDGFLLAGRLAIGVWQLIGDL